MTENQEKMINALQQIKEGFNPLLKGRGTKLREAIYDSLLGDFTSEEALLLISLIKINETSLFVKDLFSLMEEKDGEKVEAAFIDTFSSILRKIGEELQAQTGSSKYSIVPLIKDYIAFHGNISF